MLDQTSMARPVTARVSLNKKYPYSQTVLISSASRNTYLMLAGNRLIQYATSLETEVKNSHFGLACSLNLYASDDYSYSGLIHLDHHSSHFFVSYIISINLEKNTKSY